MDVTCGLTWGLKLLMVQLLLAMLAVAAMLGVQFAHQIEHEVHLRNPSHALVKRVFEAPDVPVYAKSAVRKKDIPGKHKLLAYKLSHPQVDAEAKYADLPPLTDPQRSPHNSEWDNSIAICACMYQENATDVREWVLYHRWLGVDHIYLTENSDPPPEYLVSQLQDFIDDGFVTFRAVAKPGFQQTIYLDCMRDHRHKHNWMAFIDLDEFILLRKRKTTLKEYLNDFKHEAALSMHWVNMGPAGREARPEHGGVLRHYDACQRQPDPDIKSIVNTWFLLNTAGNPHNFEYRGAMQSVDEHHRPVGWRAPLPRQCTDGSIEEPAQDIHCRPVPDIKVKEPKSVDHIAVFHYATRSRADFALKHERGGGGYKKRSWTFFERMARTAAQRGGICGELAKVADECCPVGKLTLGGGHPWWQFAFHSAPSKH